MRSADIEPQTPLNATALKDLSEELWGAPVYGATAYSLFGHLHAKSYTVTRQPDGFYVGSFLGAKGGKLDVSSPATRPEIARAASALLRSKQHLPFGLRIEGLTEEDADIPHLYFHLKPGAITRQHLAPYMEAVRWRHHALHGTVGKALDVLKTASGFAITPEETASQDDQEYISYQELRAVLRQSAEDGEISAYHYTGIPRKVACTAVDQIAAAQPHSWGELVFRGSVEYGYPRDFTWQEVAVRSLAAMGQGGYMKNAKTAHHYLVRRFAAPPS